MGPGAARHVLGVLEEVRGKGIVTRFTRCPREKWDRRGGNFTHGGVPVLLNPWRRKPRPGHAAFTVAHPRDLVVP